MSLPFFVKFFGILLGVLTRSLLPWLRKIRDGVVTGFGRRYLYSALASFLLGIILTLIIFPRFEPELSGRSFESFFKLFCLSFGFGFGWNALVLEGAAWTGAFGPNRSQEKIPGPREDT